MPTPKAKNSLLIVASSVLLAVGCQSINYKAKSLPPEFRANSRVGMDRMRLGGLLSAAASTSAVGPNDLLKVSVATGMSGEEPLVYESRVDADGIVDIPLIGQVAVGGVEPSYAAQKVAAAAVARGIYNRPQVSLVVEKQATHQVTVLGAVGEPGTKELPRGGCDVITAVAAAGGFTEEAGVMIEVLRSGSPQIAAVDPESHSGTDIKQVSFQAPMNPGSQPIAELIDLGNPASVPPEKLRLGDRDIVVVRPQEKRVIHVTGLVKSPDQFQLLDEHDFHVLDAIAMAGGVTTPIADKVLVVRQVESGAPVVVEVSISRAKTDGAENLVLQAGDLVSIESTAATVALSTFQNLFRITMGVGGNLSLF